MKNPNKKLDNYKEAYNNVKNHHLLGLILSNVNIFSDEHKMKLIDWSKESFCQLTIKGDTEASIIVNKYKKLTVSEWEFIYLTIATLLGLNIYKKMLNQNKIYKLSSLLFAMNYVRNILGNDNIPPEWLDFYSAEQDLSFKSEDSMFEQIDSNQSLYNKYKHISLLNNNLDNSFVFEKNTKTLFKYSFNSYTKTFNEIFGENLIQQAQKTIALSGNKVVDENVNLESYKAKKWFMNHFPLLAGVVVNFKIVEDIKQCQLRDIEIAAVSTEEKTIYINPLAQLNSHGMKFVMAHEVLHVALNHSSRREGRDRLTWNLACDFVINQWLVEMGIGIPPYSIYSDETLNGKSADEIYLMITHDNRIKKKLGTLKNQNAGHDKKSNEKFCDMLDDNSKYFSDFEDACKHALLKGVFLHEAISRGVLPASLVEEIKLINQPPIPWQAGLADWIAEQFPAIENRRTYSRLSRRQSSTPDIPRASYIKPVEDKITRTYGVVIDTSGSVDRELLAKSIGAVVSYSQANDVKYVRLIFCDAIAYDEGYVPIDLLMNKISVKGRGGTVLQPAINLLEQISDFPSNAPILIISDGFFEDDLIIKREHAFLVPNRFYLPFKPVGPVFEFEKN